MNQENWMAVIALIPAVVVVVIPRHLAHGAGGPLQTRRSQRLLNQVIALEDADRPDGDSPLRRAASLQHKEALFKELARARAPYSPAFAALLGGVVYAMIGLGYLDGQDEAGPTFLSLSAVFAAIAVWGFFAVSSDRRAMIQRGRGSETFALLSPHQKNSALEGAETIEAKDAKKLEREKEKERQEKAKARTSKSKSFFFDFWTTT